MSTSHAGALFDKVRAGDSAARDVLYENCFARLHLIAASLLSRECRGHTLQPTALVGELFFKLRGFEHRILNEDHFFGMAARAMRQVLIDHARVRNSRRKVAAEAIPELLSQRSAADAELWLTVKTVFRALKGLDPVAAETVWLRSVEELTLGEVSRRQCREVWRVRADYDFGTRWMADRVRL